MGDFHTESHQPLHDLSETASPGVETGRTEEPRETNHPKTSAELVDQHFHPMEIKDNQGFTRRSYTFSLPTGEEIAFSFRGKYELPVVGGDFQDIGSEPLEGIFDKEEYRQFRERYSGDDSSVFQTTKDFEGFIALASLLIPDNFRVQQAVQDIKSGEYSDESVALLKEITACSVIDDEMQQSSSLDMDAEALLLLALSGNENAQQIVSRKTQEMERIDRQQRDEEGVLLKIKAEKELGNRQEADMSKHSLVHIYEGPVERDDDGNVLLRAGTYRQEGAPVGFLVVRDTIHTSIDGPVGSHTGGSWDNYDTVVVAKAKGNIDKASMVRTEDTYFHVYPHQPLRIKDAIGIVPAKEGELEEAAVISRNEGGDTIFYRRGGYTVGHLQKLERLDDTFEGFFRNKISNDTFLGGSYAAHIGRAIRQGIHEQGLSVDARQVIEVQIQQACVELGIREADMSERQPDGTSKIVSLSQQEFAQRLANEIIERLPTEVRDIAVYQAISDQGSERHLVMANGWQNDDEVAVTKYAWSRGISTDIHLTSVESQLTDRIVDAFSDADPAYRKSVMPLPKWIWGEKGEENLDEMEDNAGRPGYHWQDYSLNISPKELASISPETRAHIYHAGVLTARY